MRKIIVLLMISLDGVMQAPGGREEDTSDNFQYGGWTTPYGDEVYHKAVMEELKPAEYLLGRKTFDIWEGYWPKHAEFWPGINEGTKYVLSATRNSTDWKNTIFVRGVADIEKIKAAEGGDIHVWGSSQVVQLLLKHDMVDELWLKIHPVILGQGKKLFADTSKASAFTLLDNIITPKGVIIAHYIKAGKVQTGSFQD